MVKRLISHQTRDITTLGFHKATKNEMTCLQNMALVRDFPRVVEQTIERLKQTMNKEESKLYPDVDRINRCKEKIVEEQRSLERYYRNRDIIR